MWRFIAYSHQNESYIGEERTPWWPMSTARTCPKQWTQNSNHGLSLYWRDTLWFGKSKEGWKTPCWETLLVWPPTATGVFNLLLHPVVILLTVTLICILLIIILYIRVWYMIKWHNFNHPKHTNQWITNSSASLSIYHGSITTQTINIQFMAQRQDYSVKARLIDYSHGVEHNCREERVKGGRMPGKEDGRGQ